MIEVFTNYLRAKVNLTEEELKQVLSCTTFKKLRKRQYLLQEGDISHHDCFITKGCLRMYWVSDDGVEHILRFAIENWWISDQESYNNNTPSKNNIDALEASELLLIEKEDFNKLVNEFPKFRYWKDQLKAKSYDVNMNRIMSNISDTAEVRYLNFIKAYPNVAGRVPLHMIASFLGVSRETLSRVRSQYAREH